MSKQSLRINSRIKASTVRLIDESKNQIGVVSFKEALERAVEAGLDLVEVGPTSDPPVCRIMDYGKWLYKQKRKLRDASRLHQRHARILKEIRLRPETEEHDLEIKLRHAREFLEKDYKVQFTIQFKGRQMLHKDIGFKIMERIQSDIEDLAKVLQPCRMTGRRMILVVAPNK
ncbi:MAG: translation initiation factor IF-3 [Planctomycetota bacterium]